MLKRKTLFLTLVLGFLLVLGFGCKGLTAEEQAAVKPITLNYWTVYNDVGQLEKFAEEYKKIRPYVTVKIKQLRAEEFDSALINALADDVAPDLVSVNVRDLKKYQTRLSEMPKEVKVYSTKIEGKYFKETVISELSNSLPSAGAIKSNFISTVYNDAIIDNKTYGLPLAVDNLAIYYNKDLLDKAGVPEPPKNWEDFMKAVKMATKFSAEGEIIQSGVTIGTAKNVSRSFDILSMLMMQSGVKMSSGNSISFTSGIDSLGSKHPAITALRFYTDFARPTKEIYTWNEKLGDAFSVFAQGKAVFYFGFAYDYPRLKAKSPQMNIEVIPMLQLNEKDPANIANYWIESVMKKSKHQNEAWDFIRFITSPENIKKYCTVTNRPTPLRSQINEQKSNPILAPFAEQILNAENWYRGSNSAVAEKAFQDLITGYLASPGSEEGQGRQDEELLMKAYRMIQQTM